MRKYIVFIAGVVISINAFSQFELSIDSVIDLEIEKHKARNISTIGYTKLACVNYGVTVTAYLFWNQHNKTYLQKFSDSEYDEKPVQRFQPIEIVDSIFFTFYNSNSDQLALEEAESFAYKPDTTRLLHISTSHSCFRRFKLSIKGQTFDKTFDFFDLREFNEDQIDHSKFSKEWIEELKQKGWDVDTLYKNTPIRNINYELNNRLRIVKWDLLISAFIERMESENEFIEIK